MKDFRKGFLVALSCIAFVCVSTLAVFAQEGTSTSMVPGLSIAAGTGITSEFGGLGASIYKSEAAHEKAVQSLKAKGLKASYEGDKGGSLIGLIPEVMVRYDITKYFFVRTGYQGGVRLTGGQWSVTITNPYTVGSAQSNQIYGGVEQANFALWSNGVEQIGGTGKTTFNYKFSSHEIPFVLGLNVPVEEGKYNVYAAIGVKYAFFKFEKTVLYAPTNMNCWTTSYTTGAGVDALTAGVMQGDRQQTKLKYNLHGLAITWMMGVDAKIYDNFGAYLEYEFVTNTDSKAVKNTKLSTAYSNVWGAAVSSGTCRYYKVGVKYWL